MTREFAPGESGQFDIVGAVGHTPLRTLRLGVSTFSKIRRTASLAGVMILPRITSFRNTEGQRTQRYTESEPD